MAAFVPSRSPHMSSVVAVELVVADLGAGFHAERLALPLTVVGNGRSPYEEPMCLLRARSHSTYGCKEKRGRQHTRQEHEGLAKRDDVGKGNEKVRTSSTGASFYNYQL